MVYVKHTWQTVNAQVKENGSILITELLCLIHIPLPIDLLHSSPMYDLYSSLLGEKMVWKRWNVHRIKSTYHLKISSFFFFLKNSGSWNSHYGTAETNPTRNHEVVGPIPGLAQ